MTVYVQCHNLLQPYHKKYNILTLYISTIILSLNHLFISPVVV